MRTILTRAVSHASFARTAFVAAACLSLLTGSAFAADAAGNWTKHCASCHGKDGKGQTKAGRMAGVKDQTDPAYQASLKDDKMFRSIKAGMKEGDKEKMKPFADKLTDDEIKALVAHVRTGSAFAADAAGNWTKHCASCHGKDGRGQTKAGRMAGVKDQTDPAYQASLKDDKMFRSIKAGMKEGDKEKMKPFADKLTDDEIKALAAHVRTFKK